MASIQRIVSPHTQEVTYRVQVRPKGRAPESANFPNLKEAKAWAISVEAAMREARHFPYAAARRTSFDALAKDYAETVLAEFGEKERATRLRHLEWWSKQFAGLMLAEVTADRISKARDMLASEKFVRGKPHKDKKTGQTLAPQEFTRSGSTVNRFIATLSHALSFAVKERQFLGRNPVSDIARKKEPRGRTRFLSDVERAKLLEACAKSDWPALRVAGLAGNHDGRSKGRIDRTPLGRRRFEGRAGARARNEERRAAHPPSCGEGTRRTPRIEAAAFCAQRVRVRAAIRCSRPVSPL